MNSNSLEMLQKMCFLVQLRKDLDIVVMIVMVVMDNGLKKKQP